MSRIGGKQYQYGQYSLSYRIMLILLALGIITTGIFFTYIYCQEKNSIESEFLLSHQYGEESLIHAVQLADQSFSFYDNAYNQPLKLALLQFQEKYNETGSNLGNLDLLSVRSELSQFFDQPIDLYVINSSAIIQNSTFEPDIGLDFSSYPKFTDRLANIREGNIVAYDAIVAGTKLGEERKYAYIPTPDHQYVLEIGINLSDFFKKQDLYKYPMMARWYNSTGQDVSSVWIYDRTVLVAPDIRTSIPGYQAYPYPYVNSDHRKDFITQVFDTKESMVIEGPGLDEITKYLYIPQINSSSVSSGLFDKVAEITYNATLVQKKEQQVLVQSILLAIIIIVALVLVAFAISRYVTRPVYQIIEDIEIIANGDYNHQIQRTKGFEFRRLESSIQKMVGTLKEDIISIRQKSNDLDTELQSRLYAEESLRAANHKLSLLGSITRHDLLNQISVISGSIDLLEEDIPVNEQNSQILTMVHDALNNISKMINLTRIYDQMGVNKPIWHAISEKIEETTKHFNMSSCTILDNTNGLEILADPMFDRVIYNLIENAFRHGGQISKIEFDFSNTGNTGLLTISDDGIGIPDSDKQKIFDRGYGKNTGFGLFLIREIISLTSIEIRETGVEGTGSRFEIHIPQGKWRVSSDDAKKRDEHQ